MSCQITLGPNNDLELLSPSGRRVYIPIGPHSTQLLWQVIWNSTGERAKLNKELVNGFPTQAVVNSWAKSLGMPPDEEKTKRAAKEAVDRWGFDLGELDIDI